MMGEIYPPHNKYYMYKNPNYQKEYREKNKEKNKKTCKEYYHKHKDVLLEKNRERHKEWYKINKEKKNNQSKEYANTHRSEMVKNVQRYVAKNKEKVKDYQKKFEQSVSGKYRELKHRHNKRWLNDSIINIEEFEEIINKKCQYCGGDNITKGIDRIKNEIGYTKENSVSCCKKCNYMKNNYTVEEFLEHVKNIYEYNQ